MAPNLPPDVAPEEPLPDNLDTTPTPTPDGIPGTQPGVYRDLGVAEPDAHIRGLIAFPIRDREHLEQRIRDIYDPSSPDFREYMTSEEWIDRYAPRPQDVEIVAKWLRSVGLETPRVAHNRLLLQFTGTVQAFNDAFGAQLRVLERKSPQAGNAPHEVFGLEEGIDAPRFVQERISAVVALDLAVPEGKLPGEIGEVSTALPPDIAKALTPEQVAHAYGFQPLYSRGERGRGVRLGVAIGASFRMKDIRAFWKAFGIEREDPRIIPTMELPITRYREGTLDVEWAGAMAPEAELVVYMGPDARNTSMIFTFNEAIARGEIDVLTDSFAHREDSEPRAVHEQYSASATMAAALGITVIGAGGDSAGVDVPSSSPYAVSIGGTRLVMNGNQVSSEEAWYYSGSGYSMTFPTPWWQDGLGLSRKRRAVADIALNAETYYWYTFLGILGPNTGTSFGAPIFAGGIAVLNGARLSEGRPRVGWINSHLYTLPEVQRTFRDITAGRTERGYETHPGWDIPTGWGAPDIEGLWRALP